MELRRLLRIATASCWWIFCTAPSPLLLGVLWGIGTWIVHWGAWTICLSYNVMKNCVDLVVLLEIAISQCFQCTGTFCLTQLKKKIRISGAEPESSCGHHLPSPWLIRWAWRSAPLSPLWALKTLLPPCALVFFTSSCNVSWDTSHRQECAFPNHVQSAEFTPGRLQSRWRNTSK